ncbi:MAG: hypothetical protein ACFFDN_26905 [Candidatus Hodarchaeota archaeon]
MKLYVVDLMGMMRLVWNADSIFNHVNIFKDVHWWLVLLVII